MDRKKKILDQENLNKLAPELHKIKKENPFSTPENYFDELTSRVADKISKENESTQSVLLTKWVIGKRRAITVGLLSLLIVISIYIIPQQNTDTNLVELTADEITTSLEDIGFHNLEEELMTTAYINTTSSSKETSDELSDEEIMYYLLSNQIEETELYN